MGNNKNKDQEPSGVQYMPIGMCVGMSLGMALGAAAGNISIGMCTGLGLGTCVGIILDSVCRKKTKDPSEDEEKED